MTVPLRQLQAVADELLGRGLPAPADAVRRARFRPDAPWSWCARCGGAQCAEGRCATPVGSSAPDAVVRLGAHAGPLRRWVVDVKHAAWEAMAEELGAALARQLMACGVVEPRQAGVVLVPVPSPWLRTRARGIDHARALADGAARVLRVPVRRVLRQRLAGTQVDANARADRASRADRWRAHRSCALRVAGAHVILVDDVRTTGATLESASGVLRTHGASRITAAVVTVKDLSPTPDRVAAEILDSHPLRAY